MNIRVSTLIDAKDLLDAVSELGEQFRTGKELPCLQLHEVETAQLALLKIQLQLRYWPRTRELGDKGVVSSDAYMFLAECKTKFGFIPKHEVAGASEQMYVKQMLDAGVIEKKKTIPGAPFVYVEVEL